MNAAGALRLLADVFLVAYVNTESANRALTKLERAHRKAVRSRQYRAKYRRVGQAMARVRS